MDHDERQKNTPRGDWLVDRIASGVYPSDEMDVDALDLLDEFHAGYPPGRLLSLLRHPDSAVVKRGAWIAGELGQAATELLPEAARLLDYPSRAVRFAAVDLVFACAGETDGALVAKVMNMICDPDRSIRWKALRFLGHAEASQIDAGVPYLKDGEIARLAIQLRSFDDLSSGLSVIADMIFDPKRLVRLFGVAAAARAAGREPSLLGLAKDSADRDVAEFAEDELRIIASRFYGE